MAEVATRRDGEAVAGTAQTPELLGAPGWMANTFDAFRYPTYRVIWIGTILSFLAFNIAMTAQGAVAFDLTGSNRAVGAVVFGQGIAMVFLNPFGGAIADRFSKRFLILLAQVVIGGTMLALAILMFTDRISILILAVGAFTVGAMFSFLGPTRTALMGEIVPEERMGNALALVQLGGTASRMLGPLLAGVMLSIGFIGSAGTYFVIAGMFVVVIATFYQIPATPVRGDRDKTSIVEDVLIGFRYVIARPRLLHILVSFHLVTILGMSQIVLLPGFSKEVLDAGNSGFGVLLAMAAGGGLVMSLVVAGIADSPRTPVYLTVSSYALAAAMILTGMAPVFVAACVTMFILGGAANAFMTLNNVLAVRNTDQEFFGRVIALVFLAWGMNGIAGLPIGAFADLVGERATFVCLGTALALITTLLALWARRIEATTPRPQPIETIVPP
jgi:MFS family permease